MAPTTVPRRVVTETKSSVSRRECRLGLQERESLQNTGRGNTSIVQASRCCNNRRPSGNARVTNRPCACGGPEVRDTRRAHDRTAVGDTAHKQRKELRCNQRRRRTAEQWSHAAEATASLLLP